MIKEIQIYTLFIKQGLSSSIALPGSRLSFWGIGLQPALTVLQHILKASLITLTIPLPPLEPRTIGIQLYTCNSAYFINFAHHDNHLICYQGTINYLHTFNSFTYISSGKSLLLILFAYIFYFSHFFQ